jgi:hypothetical protein
MMNYTRAAPYKVLQKTLIEQCFVMLQDIDCERIRIQFACEASIAPGPKARQVGFGRSSQQVRVFLAARLPVLCCPPQHLPFPELSGELTCLHMPRTMVLTRPPQHVQGECRSTNQTWKSRKSHQPTRRKSNRATILEYIDPRFGGSQGDRARAVQVHSIMTHVESVYGFSA